MENTEFTQLMVNFFERMQILHRVYYRTGVTIEGNRNLIGRQQHALAELKRVSVNECINLSWTDIGMYC